MEGQGASQQRGGALGQSAAAGKGKLQESKLVAEPQAPGVTLGEQGVLGRTPVGAAQRSH